MKWLLPVFLFSITVVQSCSPGKKMAVADSYGYLVDSLKAHIAYLADDKLEGRRTGTTGEKMAADYISSRFTTIGLLPKGTNGFFQPFEVNEGRMIAPETNFHINGDSLVTGKEFFPFPFSAAIKMEALVSVAAHEIEMPWIFDLKETLEENKSNPHFDLVDNIRKNAIKAAGRGATAVILYNSTGIADKLVFDAKDRSETLTVPVIYITKEVAAKYFKDPSATLSIKFVTAIGEKKRKGINVAGFIDNAAANTVILGAHFDHLGYGEDGNSRHTAHDAAIHNGADDNASGTAALIELARMLKISSAKNNNYLFIAFSGEELGLYGSKYYTENPTIDLKTANYMINMDMVGRLDTSRVLTVGGYGTSPIWPLALAKQLPANPDLLKGVPLLHKYDSSGTGPSDHTSFYRKDIPVLFYFTGLHTDYHKPTDDAQKINYTGEKYIIESILNLIESLNSEPKLAFTKTRESQTTTSARFSVSMGIMPDYTYSGNGVKADGISEGKPAQKAGLKAGDIVLQIGEYSISSMETYMQTLGKFKKGDKVKVKYKRGNEVIETTVEF